MSNFTYVAALLFELLLSLESLHFILAQSGTSIELRPLSFKLLLSSP